MITEITSEKIIELQTPAGGWTKESLAQLGISWPPPKGWKEYLERKASVKPIYDKSRYPKKVQKGFCRGCGDPVGKGRSSWCSSICYARHEPSIVKRRTFERDKGICQICGLDLIKAKKDWQQKLDDNPWGKIGWDAFCKIKKEKPKVNFDHVIPFSEGGATVIENMRTLCEPCHKARTKQWHKDRKSK